jgi:hypothetical protein
MLWFAKQYLMCAFYGIFWMVPFITVGSFFLFLELPLAILLSFFKIKYDSPIGGWFMTKAMEGPFDWDKS